MSRPNSRGVGTPPQPDTTMSRTGRVNGSSAYAIRRRGSCDTCNHKHIQGRYCHVFLCDPVHWNRVEQEYYAQQLSQYTPSQHSTETSQSNVVMYGAETFEDWVEDDRDIPGKVPKGMTLEGATEALMDAGQSVATMMGKMVGQNESENQYEAPGEDQSYYHGQDGYYNEQWYNENGEYIQQQDPNAAAVAEEPLIGDELNVPSWARNSGFRRCGCREGVPRASRSYVAVPETRFVGKLRIHMGDCEELFMANKCEPPAAFLGYIFTFLTSREISRAAMACRAMMDAARADPNYCDVAAMAVQNSFTAHDGFVESLMMRQGLLYTAGERRVKLWDPNTGTQLGQVARDLIDIVHLRLEEPRFIYTCMANGHVRKWALTFNANKLDFAALWSEHSGFINDVILCRPSQGLCERHKLSDHSCFLYTASDDRTARVWDTATNKCVAVVTPPTRFGSTARSLALSSRHLFVGSTRGRIYVYNLHAVCERTDIHVCKQPESGPQLFCHQTTLEHADTIIRCLTVAGPQYSQRYLISGSVDGTISIWSIPSSGLVFTHMALLRAHTGSVTAFACSWRHLYSGSTDSIKVWVLGPSVSYVRTLGTNEQTVRSIFIEENAVEGGRLFAGLSSGTVLVYGIGTYG